MKSQQLILSGQGRDYNYSQDHCYIKLSSSQTNGELCMVEDMLKPGFYLKRHHHKVMTETFYVLEGEVEFRFDEEVIIARTGDTLTIPPNVWHAVKSEGVSKMLTIFKNGRFDEYLEKLSKMTDSDFGDVSLMKQVSEAYDIYEE